LGFYAKNVLPILVDLSMKNPEVTRLRAEWIPKARGEVLEIGVGSGLNLPFYTKQVERVRGLDISPELQKMAHKRTAGLAVPVEFLEQSAEKQFPVVSESIETVVITWTLCSIADPRPAFEEVKRVLKRDGQLIFIEHGRAPDSTVARWQNRLNPVWKRIAGGCNLNREVDVMLRQAGFEITGLRLGYLPAPRPLTYTYQGTAVSASR
jgi:ubiquinone/menaquinone biosynthesis C-methylase UbiE